MEAFERKKTQDLKVGQCLIIVLSMIALNLQQLLKVSKNIHNSRV